MLLRNQTPLRPARPEDVMASRGAEKRHRWYAALYVQVLAGIAAGIIVGWIAPQTGEALRPIGDVFLKMIKMVIGLVIFCTVVTGLGGMSDLKKVGRVGGKALVYFEVVSTLALLFGAIVANVVRPGAGFNADPARLDAAAVATYVGHAQQSGTVDFLMGIVPSTIFDAFAKGDTLPIIFISVLFGYVLSRLGERGKPVGVLIEAMSQVVFGIIHVLMRFAPLGAFGAMAYTIGRFGMGSLKPLFGLIATFYVTGAVFVCVVMGAISRWAGFNIFKLMRYLKEELLIGFRQIRLTGERLPTASHYASQIATIVGNAAPEPLAAEQAFYVYQEILAAVESARETVLAEEGIN